MNAAADGKRTAILHIGVPKTGTTSLQHFLWANEAALQARGVGLIREAGNPNSRALVTYAANDYVGEKWRRRDGLTTPRALARFRSQLESELAAACAAQSAPIIAFSSEHCAQTLRAPEEVERLRALLAPHFDRFVIVCYLRRQVDLATSQYSTRLKSGAPDPHVLQPAEKASQFLDFATLLTMWSDVFGDEAVHPRLLSAAELKDGDLFSDFAAFCGIESLDGLDTEIVRNVSLSAGGQRVLRALNERITAQTNGLATPERGRLPHILADAFIGSGRRPARADAEAFQRRYDAGNEIVRARWFPDRDRLFSEDFSKYPLTEDPAEPDTEEALDATTALWRAAMEELLRRGRASVSLRAENARLRGDRRRAEQILRRSLFRDPHHPPHIGALARLLASDDRRDEAATLVADALAARPDDPDLQRFATQFAHP